jgi:hypothetical protein
MFSFKTFFRLGLFYLSIQMATIVAKPTDQYKDMPVQLTRTQTLLRNDKPNQYKDKTVPTLLRNGKPVKLLY